MERIEDVMEWIDGNRWEQQERLRRRRSTRRSVARVAVSLIATLALVAAALVGFASADAATTPETPATEFHGLPGNNPGHSDEAVGAAPAGTAANADGGMHNIAGVQANGAADTGQPPACTAHGGLDAANPNC